MTGVVEKVRLARFFAALAVKEHFAPRLHVRPLVAELFITENCNLRCISCACWRETTEDELSTDEWKRAAVQDGVGALTLADLPRMMAEHDRSHTADIARLIEEFSGSDCPPADMGPRSVSAWA